MRFWLVGKHLLLHKKDAYTLNHRRYVSIVSQPVETFSLITLAILQTYWSFIFLFFVLDRANKTKSRLEEVAWSSTNSSKTSSFRIISLKYTRSIFLSLSAISVISNSSLCRPHGISTIRRNLSYTFLSPSSLFTCEECDTELAYVRIGTTWDSK